MRIEYLNIMEVLEKNPHFLHDRDAQSEWLVKREKLIQPKHFEMAMRYVYRSIREEMRCTHCDSYAEDNWNFCPYCGMELDDDDIDLNGESVSEVKKMYKSETGDVMPDEEVEKILAMPMLKVWVDC